MREVAGIAATAGDFYDWPIQGRWHKDHDDNFVTRLASPTYLGNMDLVFRKTFRRCTHGFKLQLSGKSDC